MATTIPVPQGATIGDPIQAAQAIPVPQGATIGDPIQDPNQPGFFSRLAAGASDEAKSMVTGAVQPLVNDVKAVIPTNAKEHTIADIAGPGALFAYKTASRLIDSAESVFKARGQDWENAKQDFSRAVNEFHQKDYRNAASTVGDIASDIGGRNADLVHGREFAEGTRKGGDLATPLGKTAVDAAALFSGSDTAQELPGKVAAKVGAAADAVARVPELTIKQLQLPEEPKYVAEPPKPVTSPVTVDTPLSDAVVRKSMGGKNLSEEARNTIREHAGDVVPKGSSPELQLIKTIKPVNEAIVTQGTALNEVLEKAGQFSTSPASEIEAGISKLKENLPGGEEDRLGKAIDKEVNRAKDVMQSTSPLEINGYIRELDKRIDSYTAPEDSIESPAGAADAARVTLRRILRNKLNTEIPETQPINDVLSRNIELRSLLRKKFGDIASDPVAADAQFRSEFNNGRTGLDVQEQNQALKEKHLQDTAQVQRNRALASKAIGATVGAVAGHLSPIPGGTVLGGWVGEHLGGMLGNKVIDAVPAVMKKAGTVADAVRDPFLPGNETGALDVSVRGNAPENFTKMGDAILAKGVPGEVRQYVKRFVQEEVNNSERTLPNKGQAINEIGDELTEKALRAEDSNTPQTIKTGADLRNEIRQQIEARYKASPSGQAKATQKVSFKDSKGKPTQDPTQDPALAELQSMDTYRGRGNRNVQLSDKEEEARLAQQWAEDKAAQDARDRVVQNTLRTMKKNDPDLAQTLEVTRKLAQEGTEAQRAGEELPDGFKGPKSEKGVPGMPLIRRVAEELGIDEKTVRAHYAKIQQKYGPVVRESLGKQEEPVSGGATIGDRIKWRNQK
jgi:hypothetical protein